LTVNKIDRDGGRCLVDLYCVMMAAFVISNSG